MNTLAQRLPILGSMTVLADAVRGRMLLLLERRELTVSELCAVLQLPQSTTSRHLKILAEGGWVSSRRDGTRRLYSLAADLAADARRLWELIREPLAADPAVHADRERLRGVLTERRVRSRAFFTSAAGEWDRLRDETFGRRFLPSALVGLLDDRWIVGDLGCGTGRVTEALAPFVGRVVAVDDSEPMLAAASERVGERDDVELRRGALESLPIENESLDAATLVLVLHHVAEPGAVVAEAARVLRPGGRLLIVDMLPHDRPEYRKTMGHVWAGFAPERIERLATAAGFATCRLVALPPDPDAKGPALFAATMKKQGHSAFPAGPHGKTAGTDRE